MWQRIMVGTALMGCSWVVSHTAHAQCTGIPFAATSPVGGEAFGASVILSETGDRLVVGAPGEDGVGAVYVFADDAGNWILEQRLDSPSAALGDQFGASVAIAGDWIVVGAPGDDDGTMADAGAVYFFELDGAWSEQFKRTSSTPAANLNFGASVAIYGSKAAVGAPLDSEAGSLSGAVHVLEFDGATWDEQAKLMISSPSGSEQLGWSIALDGDLLVTGAPGDDGTAGRAHSFIHVVDTWHPVGSFNPQNVQAGDFFGSSIALDGVVAVGGSPNAGAGAAHVFTLGSEWVEEQALFLTGGASGDQFGASCSMRDDAIVVGAPDHTRNGAIVLFRHDGVGWVETLFLGGEAAEGRYGAAVTLAFNRFAVGAPASGDPGTGEVRLFEDIVTPDCNDNLIPDPCEVDCNANGVPDDCDIADGVSSDCDANGVPDECEDPKCLPIIATVNVDGEIWTDPTNDGAQDVPLVTIEGMSLFATDVFIRTVDYQHVVSSFTVDPSGMELTFDLPPFPPAANLDGTFEAEIIVVNDDGEATFPIVYEVLRRTVGTGGDFATIQAAMAAARSGWAIVVQPGVVYTVNSTIDFSGLTAITLSGQTAHPNVEAASQEVDILRFAGNDRSIRIQQIDFNQGGTAIQIMAGAAPIIDEVYINDCRKGIEVTGDSAPFIRNCRFSAETPDGSAVDGTAISVQQSTAVILDSRFIGNLGAERGTVYLEATTEPVVLSNNWFLLNEADEGGAIYIGDAAEARVFNNLIEQNLATSTGGRGGAIFIETQDAKTPPLVEIAQNRIVGNEADGDAECEPLQPANGGAIFVAVDAAPRIVDNVLMGNQAAVGAAIAICKGANPLVQRNLIACNEARPAAASDFYAPGIFVFDAEPIVLNNSIVANDVTMPGSSKPQDERGGGIHAASLSSPGSVLANNVIVGNDGWGIYLDGAGSFLAVDLLHNDQWENEELGIDGLCPNCNPTCNMIICQVCGCENDPAGGRAFGNIGVDPLFVAGDISCGTAVESDFDLGAASPLLAAGLPDDDTTFVDGRYRLYHDAVPVDIGRVIRDGVLAPSGPRIEEVREVASHAAIVIGSAVPAAVRIQSSPLLNRLDFSLIFSLDAQLAGQPCTQAVRFDFPGAMPALDPDGRIELPWLPEFDPGAPVTLCADLDDDLAFETIIGGSGVIDVAEGTMRFDGVDLSALAGHWVIGVVEAELVQTCPEDLDGSGDIGFGDLVALLASWGPCVECPEDLDQDGTVGFSDLVALLSAWGMCR